jgi:hypothetical protein
MTEREGDRVRWMTEMVTEGDRERCDSQRVTARGMTETEGDRESGDRERVTQREG